MKSNIEQLKRILSFDDGPLLALGSVRNKDGADKNKNFMKVACYSWEDVEALIVDNKEVAKIRLYLSYNNRDKVVAYKLFVKELIESYEEVITKKQIPFGVSAKWFSCLAKSRVKSVNNYFMLDLDAKRKLKDVVVLMKKHKINVVQTIETKNGHHIFFKPCDTRALLLDIATNKIDCELKKDDYTLLSWNE